MKRILLMIAAALAFGLAWTGFAGAQDDRDPDRGRDSDKVDRAPEEAQDTGETVVEAVKPDGDVDVDTRANAWYRNPWIIGGIVLAVILIAVIIGAVARSGGGGTTIVKQ